MGSAPRSDPNEGTPASLRSSFAWTLAGNVFHAAAQWAILSLVAKLGGGEMLGQYALAAAIATPVAMLSHLNLRALLATDVKGEHPFGDYLAVRLGISGLGMAVIAGLALSFSQPGPAAAAILLVGLLLSLESLSDLYYGAMQRRDQMQRVARSMITRGIVSVAAFGVTLWAVRSLFWALAAMTAGRLAVLAAYDRPAGSAGECLSRSGPRAGLAILRTALPLGVVLMMVALNTNLPRYVIERRLGIRELGAFAAVASFVTVGSTVVNALGQAATPRLARCFGRSDLGEFLGLALKLGGAVLLLGLAGVMVALVLGEAVLRIVYRPEYAAYSGLLVLVMCAAALGYLAIAMGFVITSVRAFKAQVPLFCCVAASCGAASWLLVPRFGLRGAVLALAVSATVQICGGALILFRALHPAEAAA